MEYKDFVKWCVNQYLQIVDQFKGRIYHKHLSYAPYLVNRERLEKAVFMTALYNGAPFTDLDRIDEILNVSYEQVKGNWKAENMTCMNLSRFPVSRNTPYQIFFMTLLVVEDDLYYSGDRDTVNWIRDSMAALPVCWEQGIPGKGLCGSTEENLARLQTLLRNYRDYFYPVESQLGRRFCVDYMRICNFYEYYWNLAQYGIENRDVLKKLR